LVDDQHPVGVGRHVEPFLRAVVAGELTSAQAL
jgi:hypothetical protein